MPISIDRTPDLQNYEQVPVHELQTYVPDIAGGSQYDASTLAALSKLAKTFQDDPNRGPITGDEVLELIKAASDYGQVTRDEYLQILNFVEVSALSPEAAQAFGAFDAAAQRQFGGQVGNGLKDTVVLDGSRLQDALAAATASVPSKLASNVAAAVAAAAGSISAPAKDVIEDQNQAPPPIRARDQTDGFSVKG